LINIRNFAFTGESVITDPNLTEAWAGTLSPEIKSNVSVKTIPGRGRGESIQMKFQGEGIVAIQPFEEIYFQSS
jgi:uncharacterized protein (AIM24 family)